MFMQVTIMPIRFLNKLMELLFHCCCDDEGNCSNKCCISFCNFCRDFWRDLYFYFLIVIRIIFLVALSIAFGICLVFIKTEQTGDNALKSLWSNLKKEIKEHRSKS